MTRVSIILTCLLLTLSCKQKQAKRTDLSTILKAYTDGMIKDTDQLEYRFLNNVNINQDKIESSITVTPQFAYTTTYDDKKKILIIQPKDALKRNTAYTVTLDLDAIIKSKSPGKLISQLKTFAQDINVEKKGTILNEDTESTLQLNLELAIEESEEKIKQIFDYPADKISVENKGNGIYYLEVLFESSIGPKKLKWDAKNIEVDKKGTVQWDYLSKEFEVSNTYYNREENHYEIYFSKFLDAKQDAQGLIQVGNKDAKYKIFNNSITVYLGNITSNNVNLTINKGLKSKAGDKLAQSLNYQIEAKIVLPEVRFVENGVYIPHSGIFKIPFKAKGLDSILVSIVGIKSDNATHYSVWNDMSYMDEMEMLRFGKLVHQKSYPLIGGKSSKSDWNEYGIDMTSTFQREKGTIYYIRLDILPSHTILDCNDSILDDYELDLLSSKWFNDRSQQYRYYRYFNYEDRRNPCKIAYYFSQGVKSKTVHCTNIFPIIKKAGQDIHVAAKDLLENKLANGATVDLIDLQGYDIESKTIQNSGTVTFKDLDTSPQAIRVNYQGEVSYFSIRQGKENQLTEFDISSDVKDVDNKIFVYTERDVWRPSDTIYMDIMLNRSKSAFPDGLPIVVKLKNPKGVMYERYIQNIDDEKSIYSFAMPTHLEAKTGYWSAEITVGPLKKNKSLRVETIKPNDVELEYNFEDQEGEWIYNNKLKGKINVQYLTGFPMRDGKVQSAANVKAVYTPFDKYKNYSLLPRKVPQPIRDLKLSSINTSQDGTATFISNHDFKSCKGVCKVTIDSKISLPGGGLNTETESLIISPYSSYVGIEKSTGSGWRGSYAYGETPSMEIVNLDGKGNLSDQNQEVKIEVLKYTKDWWYDRYRLNRNHRSHSNYRYETVKETKLSLRNGQTTYTHDDPGYESGMYLVRVTDPKSGHQAEHTFHYVADANYTVDSDPAFINLSLEKTTYRIDETVNIKLPKIQDAQALVSIESGDRVLDYFWTDLNTPNLELKVQEEWFPNFFLHVSIVQNYDQKNNDRPLRMYTVEKITVEQNDNHLRPIIECLDKVEPNSSFDITIKEDNGKSMEYTLAVVDQGLLNLTGYSTPDPLSHFAKTVALRVMTWDIFSMLIYHSNPSFAGILSIGGDAALEKKKDESADFNRFVPVVYHLGPYWLKSNSTKTHKIELPNYLGQLRVMVVACNQLSYGHNEKYVKVVSPLMIQSQLPRSLNITDKVEVPVTIFKDETSISQVNLSGQANNGLINFSNSSRSIDLSSDDQIIETLIINTSEESGTTEINFSAEAGKYRSDESTKIFVNYPNSYSEQEERYQIAAGEKINIDINSFGYEKTKNVDLTVSGALLPNFSKHYQNLIQYPYGCLEQTTSRAFAMLHINSLMNLTPKQELDRKDYLDAAITKINSYQQPKGHFNYWKNSYYHQWSDLYAAHFLLEARDLGAQVSSEVIQSWIKNKATKVNKWKVEGIENEYRFKREIIYQAYGLYLLSKAGKPAKSAMNRFRSRNNLPQMAKVFLSGAYYYANMDQYAVELLNDALDDGQSGRIDQTIFGSAVRDKAIVIDIMSKIARSQQLDRYYEDWVTEVNNKSWLSTQEQGFMFLAAASYLGESNISDEIEFDITSQKYTSKEKLPSHKNKNFAWNWDEITDQVTIENPSKSTIYVTKTERAISKELYAPAQSNAITMKVKISTRNGKSVNLQDIQQGDDLDIKIDITNTDIIDHENMAVTLKMPSGWELLNPRLYTTNKGDSDRYIYQDYRDDKVYTFFRLNKNETKTYYFKAKASLKGDYYMPAIFCENMYNGEVYARGTSQRTIIK